MSKKKMFLAVMLIQLMAANAVSLGISMHEMYGIIVEKALDRIDARKAKKELKKKEKEAKQAA